MKVDNEKQEVYRKNVIDYSKKFGVKYCFISTQIGISKSLISHWLKGRRNLREDTLIMLDKFLNNNK